MTKPGATNFPKSKKERTPPKEPKGAKDIGSLIGKFYESAKKNRMDPKDFKQKLLGDLEQQMLIRKQDSKEILSGLASLLETLEADLEVQTENELKLQHMAAAALKSAEGQIRATEDNIKAVKSIVAKLKNQCERFESEEMAANTKMADELEDYMNELQQQLIDDTKKKQVQNLKETFLQAMNKLEN